MATEVEYVNYKDFVADLEPTENPGVDDVTVVSNGTDGPRAVPANTSALTNTATDSDLTAAANFELQTATGKKKAPANLFAKQSALETTNGNVTALTTYAQNVAHSIAPEFDPTRDSEHAYPAGYSVTYTDGKVYTFKVDHYGVWNAADVDETPLTSVVVKPLGVCNKVLSYIMGEQYKVMSATYSDGVASSLNVTYIDGNDGTISITRDSNGNAISVVATYDGRNYQITITRNGDGNVTSTDISEVQ